MSQSSKLLTATALLAKHTDQLRHWGAAGNSRYGLALSNFIADEGKRQQDGTMSRLLMAAMIKYASDKQTEIADQSIGASEAEQRQLFADYMQYQAIIERVNEGLNG